LFDKVARTIVALSWTIAAEFGVTWTISRSDRYRSSLSGDSPFVGPTLKLISPRPSPAFAPGAVERRARRAARRNLTRLEVVGDLVAAGRVLEVEGDPSDPRDVELIVGEAEPIVVVPQLKP
jgi:hypothetical protein